MILLSLILWAVAVLAVLPAAVFAIECIASLLPSRPAPQPTEPSTRPRLAVLMPAHDEAAVIAATLESIIPQLAPGDRILVVADNCSDSTPDAARLAGAEVVERHDTERRGKGYALDFGVRALESDPPAIVIVIDADCRLHDGALEALARRVEAAGRPAQAVNLLDPPVNAGPRDAVSALAFLFKNFIRPLGLDRLNAPCLLSMCNAFPWEVIKAAPLAGGNIVEDMQLGIDLAIAGHPPVFCEHARVSGRLPARESAAMSQRTRWEHGHLRTLRTQSPRLFLEAIQQRRLDLAALGAELTVPPLSLLVVLMLASFVICALGGLMGASWWPMAAVVNAGAIMAIGLLGAWWTHGRDRVPASAVKSIPAYIAWKIPLYLRFLSKPQAAWVRTDRETGSPPARAGEPTGAGAPPGAGQEAVR